MDETAGHEDTVTEPARLDESDLTDTALLEDALHAALDAHTRGEIAAPFGLDMLALRRARQQAERMDVGRMARLPIEDDFGGVA